MLTPDDISREAENEKRKEQERRRKEAEAEARKKKNAAAAVKTYHAYSYYTYNRIYHKGMNHAVWLLLWAPGITCVALYFLGDGMGGLWLLIAGLVLVGIFGVRWLVDVIAKLSTYDHYKNFANTLKFKLEGWEVLGSLPMQLKTLYWSGRTSIKIVLKDTATQEDHKVIGDALYLFIKAANSQFYEPEIGSDGRAEWKKEEPLKLVGSSDVCVIGQMYKLIDVYLRSIQDSRPVIASVKVYFGREIFKVEPRSISD